MEVIVGGDWASWYISAGADFIELVCPSCNQPLEMEQYTTYTMNQLIQSIGQHQRDEH